MKEINAALKQQGLSIRQLAIRAGMPYANVYDLLHGKRLPRSGEIEKIRTALGLNKAE